jgi:hypothetical protein
LIFTVPQGKDGVLGVSQDVLLIGGRGSPSEDRAVSQNHRFGELIARRRSRFSSRFELILLSIILTATTAAPFDFARADDCLAAPNSTAPKGSHWYYHINRATRQKCWYVRAIEKRQGVTSEATSVNSAMPPANVSQTDSSVSGDADSAMSQSKPITGTEESALGSTPRTQTAAALPEARLSDTNLRSTTPTTGTRPTPPPIAPLVKADDAVVAMASNEPVYLVADTSDSVSKKDKRKTSFHIPVALFPALAFGLVIVGFGSRFLMSYSAARRAQEIDYTEAITTPGDRCANPASDRNGDEAISLGEDDFDSFVAVASGRGSLERIVSSDHSANEIGAREAKLAQLREDIGRRLGWGESEQQHPSRRKLAS